MGFCQREKNPQSSIEDKSPKQSDRKMDEESAPLIPQVSQLKHDMKGDKKYQMSEIDNNKLNDVFSQEKENIVSGSSDCSNFQMKSKNKNTAGTEIGNLLDINEIEADLKNFKLINAKIKAGNHRNNVDENENFPPNKEISTPTNEDKTPTKQLSNKKSAKADVDEQTTSPVGKGLSIKDFDFLKNLGKGAFGDVFLVKKNCGLDAGAQYALKMIYKVKVKDDESFDTHFNSEREALERVRGSNFLSQLYFAFQTDGHLFIVMDYNCGGQLLQQFTGKNALLIHEVKFYMAELLLAVNHLHERGIIHRDIKPENILLDKNGHIVLIDYGLSKHVDGSPNDSYVGTEPYIAPEILLHKPHDRVADFWSIGVLGYEMITGEPPFDLSQTDEKLRKSVLERDVRYPPKFFPKATKSVINGLLQRNPKSRLGAATKNSEGGVKCIMEHQFFKVINWKDAQACKLKPPIIPKPEEVNYLKGKAFKEPRYCSFRRHFEDYEFSWLEKETAKS